MSSRFQTLSRPTAAPFRFTSYAFGNRKRKLRDRMSFLVTSTLIVVTSRSPFLSLRQMLSTICIGVVASFDLSVLCFHVFDRLTESI